MFGLSKQLELTPEASDEARRWHGRLKDVHEFLDGALDAAGGKEGLQAVVDALANLAPWAGTVVDAAVESLPPVKFLLKLFEGFTKVDDPNALGQLAFTLAYQRAVQQAVTEVMGLKPPSSAIIKRILPATAGSYDFTLFSWEQPHDHVFLRDARRALEAFGEALGFDGTWNTRLQREVSARFVPNLKGILSHGKTRERFAPLRDRLDLGTSDSVLRAALLDHADMQRWVFEEKPVLRTEPFSLAEVYVEPACTLLEWDAICREGDRQQPFNPELPRRPLLETVLGTLGDPLYRDAVIVQGPAGSGKSSFTLRLCASLVQAGITPLRIELKHLDVRADVPLEDKLARALELRGSGDTSRFLPQSIEYGRELLRLFDEEIAFRGLSVCPYVLILDGWDELPLTGSHNYLERLRSLLHDLNELFMRRRGPAFPVRIVLAGRPSDFLAQTRMLRPTTRIVSLQPWGAQELTAFIDKVGAAQARRDALTTQLKIAPTAAWRLPERATLERLVNRFRNDATGRTLDVLGSPLIAHLCFRYLGEEQRARAELPVSDLAPSDAEARQGVVDALLTDETSLYRHLVDLVIAKAAKPPEADYEPDRGAMFAGDALRRLLHRTAEAMSVLGVENVARDELLLRLGMDDLELDRQLVVLEGEDLVSRLMISFFFKGGHKALGCEFSHKSFREYLFAERIVEALKDYGRKQQSNDLPERCPDEYWKDFDPDDPRHALSRRVSDLLGPQWLTLEVALHVARLIAFEIERALRNAPAHSARQSSTPPCSRAAWESIREGLADLWDWWGEGVHLRQQPRRRPASREYDWLPPHAVEVCREARFRAARDIRPPPIRLITLDSHLGDALCTLNSIVHDGLLTEEERGESPGNASHQLAAKPTRRYQASSNAGLRFAPSGLDPGYFRLYSHRINAAGYRSSGWFPCLAFLAGTDFIRADLGGADLSGALLSRADLSAAYLNRACMSNAILRGAILKGADLSRADLSGAVLSGADLSGACLSDAQLNRADLRGATLRGAILTGADLSGADLSGADLSGADLSWARVIQEQLEQAIGRDDVKLSQGLSVPAMPPNEPR